MSNCLQCGSVPDINNEGYLVLFTTVSQFRFSLISLVNETGLEMEELNGTIIVHYFNYSELDQVVSTINNNFNMDFKRDVIGCCLDKKEDVGTFLPFIPFNYLFNRIKFPNLLKIIQQQEFKNHIQPIIYTKSNEVYGYEFLLRSKNEENHFYPNELFAFSQNSGLQSALDNVARMTAIKTSSQKVRKGLKSFINFLPSSIYNPDHCLRETFKTIEEVNIQPEDLVFEVVETEKIHDMIHLKNIFQTYQKQGVSIALDDVGSGFATIEVIQQLRPNYIKIDRNLIDRCDEEKIKQHRVQQIVSVAKDMGSTVLAEGIERKEELEYCKSIEIDLAQGYYIGKPQEEPI